MNWNVISIFPEMMDSALSFGVVGQARKKQKTNFEFINPRSFTSNIHKTVDDRPFGGGDGMVLMYQPLKQAIESLKSEVGHRVLLSPQGHTWSDRKAREWAQRKTPITLVCGRYGGIDQRFINEYIDEEISIGDYVLSGGELGALVLIDSVVRLLPEVLGNALSADAESFADGLLEAPLFTRPQEIAKDDAGVLKVPQVFLEGDHRKIEKMRRLLSILTTFEKRPDLITEAHHDELLRSANLLSSLSLDDLKACGLNPEKLN